MVVLLKQLQHGVLQTRIDKIEWKEQSQVFDVK